MLKDTIVVAGHRVRPVAGRPRGTRPRPPPTRSSTLAGRRRRPSRASSTGRPARSASTPSSTSGDRDVHATVLHQLGLDPRRLEVPGRKRLEIDYGKPITQILA
ncbi:MAG: hypothetical protein U0797_13755 [Gemmataceae bacterium]